MFSRFKQWNLAYGQYFSLFDLVGKGRLRQSADYPYTALLFVISISWDISSTTNTTLLPRVEQIIITASTIIPVSFVIGTAYSIHVICAVVVDTLRRISAGCRIRRRNGCSFIRWFLCPSWRMISSVTACNGGEVHGTCCGYH
jgi:hypothetical protein